MSLILRDEIQGGGKPIELMQHSSGFEWILFLVSAAQLCRVALTLFFLNPDSATLVNCP
jgi:hypothetical protein